MATCVADRLNQSPWLTVVPLRESKIRGVSGVERSAERCQSPTCSIEGAIGEPGLGCDRVVAHGRDRERSRIVELLTCGYS